ncbi:MAG: hypothetical protein WDA09_04135 [Bacteriovoracaceae bacterium]
MYRVLLFLCFSLSVQAITLENHSWILDDISEQSLSIEQIQHSLRTNWDREADSVDLAHLYSYQLDKKFEISSGKVFLFSGDPSAQVATLINDSNQLMAFDHQQKKFLNLSDWLISKAQKNCLEIMNPSDQIIFLMQTKRFLPSNGDCYYMIQPGHIYQQEELYPYTTPKQYFESDIVDACFSATDRRLFKKDRKRCISWLRKL